MRVLTSQRHPQTGAAMPIPTQAVVTRCMPMPKMATATMKFGIAPNNAGGYWTLNKAQMDEILRLKDSDEVKRNARAVQCCSKQPFYRRSH